jgi:hypothetical protein
MALQGRSTGILRHAASAPDCRVAPIPTALRSNRQASGFAAWPNDTRIPRRAHLVRQITVPQPGRVRSLWRGVARTPARLFDRANCDLEGAGEAFGALEEQKRDRHLAAGCGPDLLGRGLNRAVEGEARGQAPRVRTARKGWTMRLDIGRKYWLVRNMAYAYHSYLIPPGRVIEMRRH